MGSDIIVEFAKESRPRRNYEDRGGGGDRGRYVQLRFYVVEIVTYPLNSYRSEGGFRGGGGGGGGRGKPPGIRLVVTGVSRDTSWQVCLDRSFLPVARGRWSVRRVDLSSSCYHPGRTVCGRG